jgi:hypothetical protein
LQAKPAYCRLLPLPDDGEIGPFRNCCAEDCLADIIAQLRTSFSVDAVGTTASLRAEGKAIQPQT